MKKLIAFVMMVLTMLITSCSSSDEVWGLRIGESRDNVAMQLKERGYETGDFSEYVFSSERDISVKGKIEFHGIEWDFVTCSFDEKDNLMGVAFETNRSCPHYKIENLSQYIKEEGYPELREESHDFYVSDKLPMTVILSIYDGGNDGIRLNYAKDAYKDNK